MLSCCYGNWILKKAHRFKNFNLFFKKLSVYLMMEAPVIAREKCASFSIFSTQIDWFTSHAGRFSQSKGRYKWLLVNSVSLSRQEPMTDINKIST